MTITENVIKIFAYDAFVCAISGELLKPFMMKKHNWDEKKYEEYANIYLTNLNRITTDGNLVKLNKADVSGSFFNEIVIITSNNVVIKTLQVVDHIPKTNNLIHVDGKMYQVTSNVFNYDLKCY